jgi:Tol biopolymer transport system component
MNAEMDVGIETVCSLRPGCDADGVTTNGHVFAFCPEDDGRLRFFWDGALGEPFALGELRDKSAAVYASDDGAHIAYMGVRGESQFVGRDGTEDPAFATLSRSVPPTFGGGGRHLAYGAHLSGDDFRLILDGVPVDTEPLAPTAAVFSPDGERLAYTAMRGNDRSDSECRIILDGRPGEWFAGTRNAPGAMQFSPDGRRFAYYAVDGDLHARWYVDGVPQRLFNEAPSLTLARFRGISVLEPPLPARFSPDSQRFAYFADVVEKGVAIIEDDVAGPLFKELRAPVFSPDSRHLAYVGRTYGNKMALVIDGAVSSEWDVTGTGEPVFSSDSRRVAVTLERVAGGFLRKRKLYAVAVGGRSFPEEPGDDASLAPAFSPDGTRVAWWLQRGRESLMVIDGIVEQNAVVVESDFRFDGMGRVVYAGRSGSSQTIVVDGRLGPLANAVVSLATAEERFAHVPLASAPVPFRISADGAHVIWAGVFDGVVRPVLDDEVGPAFDLILDCSFNQNGAAVWWAQRGREVVRVTSMPSGTAVT